MDAQISFAKLKDGSWGIRSTSALVPGKSYVVPKKDGSRTVVKVSKVVWSSKGITLATIVSDRTPKPSTRHTRGPSCGCPCHHTPQVCRTCEYDECAV